MLAVDAGVDLAALKVDVDARVAQGAAAAVAGNNGLERERRDVVLNSLIINRKKI